MSTHRRNGPRVLAESNEPREIARAVTSYIARRIIERERALAAEDRLGVQFRAHAGRDRFWRGLRNFLIGLLLGLAAILAAAFIIAKMSFI